ncbi:unnamed protein product, partial [Sphacelaria rigidula]
MMIIFGYAATGLGVPACCQLCIILVTMQSSAKLPWPWEVLLMENAPPPSPARGSLTVIGRLAFVLDHNSPVVVKVSNPTKNDGYSVSHLVPKNSLIFARNQAITGKSKVEKISVAGTTPCYFSSIDVSGTQNRGFHDSREQVLWRMGGGNLHYDC